MRHALRELFLDLMSLTPRVAAIHLAFEQMFYSPTLATLSPE